MKLLLLFAFVLPLALPAQDAETQIKTVLTTQIDSWNKGDLATFVTTYANNCIFVGKKITQGKAQLLARYQKTYPTRAAMGQLTFDSMAVHLLDKDVAMVTANWHLERSAAGGGAVGGYFSLVMHQEKGGWKIALDHTSAS